MTLNNSSKQVYTLYETNADREQIRLIMSSPNLTVVENRMVEEFKRSLYSTDFMILKGEDLVSGINTTKTKGILDEDLD